MTPGFRIRHSSLVIRKSTWRSALCILPSLFLLFAACDLLNSREYFPLGFKYSWDYRTTTTCVVRGTRDTTYILTGSATTSVVSPANVQGQDGWQLSSASGGDTQAFFYVDLDDKLLEYDSLADLQPEVVLRFPLDSAAGWAADSTPESGRLNCHVEGQFGVGVPAGGFDSTWLVRQTYENLPGCTLRVWYADGVGKVKSTQVTLATTPDETTRTTTTLELTAYKTQ
jgi:hypothetical protein